MSAVGFLLLGQMSRGTSIWGFALIYIGVVTIGTNIGFSYAMSGLLNNWFYRRKAMAMSVFHALDSIIPALLVPVVALAIITWGLQFTFNVIGIILLATVLPLTLLIRNDPESMGLTMDGDPATGANAPEGEAAQDDRLRHWVQPRDYAVREALRTFSFWVLVTGTALRLVAKAAVMLHIIPIIVSKGFSQQESAVLFSLLMVTTIPLYLILGWLGDRFPKHWVMVAAAVAGTGSYALLALPWQGLGVVLGFVVLFAVAEASAPTNWAVLGEYFGRRTFSQLRGIIMFVNFPVVLLAPVFVGRWFDDHGSYDFPLWVFTVVFALSALTFAIMRNPSVRAALADADAEPAARA
jgi:sugar phosphate permease